MHYKAPRPLYIVHPSVAIGDTMEFGKLPQIYTCEEIKTSEKGQMIIVWSSRCRTCKKLFRIFTPKSATSGVSRNCELHRVKRDKAPVGNIAAVVRKESAPVVNKAGSVRPPKGMPAGCTLSTVELNKLIVALPEGKKALMFAWMEAYDHVTNNRDVFLPAKEAQYYEVLGTSLDDML